jgi:hypothetical protein
MQQGFHPTPIHNATIHITHRESYNAPGLALNKRGWLQVRLHERLPRFLRFLRIGPLVLEQTPTSGFMPCGASLILRFSAHLLHVYAPNEFHVCTKGNMMIHMSM